MRFGLLAAALLVSTLSGPAVAQRVSPVATSDREVTGVAAAQDGRIVNFSRWEADVPTSVAQVRYAPGRVRYFDEVMTFRPAYSLAAHRPPGSVIRARLQVYKALSDVRHRHNGIAPANTASIDEIPA